MNDAVIVKIGNGREGSTDEVGGVGFVVGAFSADPVEEFAAESEIGDEIDWRSRRAVSERIIDLEGARKVRTIVHGLEIVHQCQDVLMAHGHPFQYCDFIPYLWHFCVSTASHGTNPTLVTPVFTASTLSIDSRPTYHMLPPSHHSLVDHFRRIISPRINMYALLHHGIASSS